MRFRSRVVFGSPTGRVAALAAVTMLVAILGAGALVAGAQPSPSPVPHEVPTELRPAWVTGTVEPGGGEPTVGSQVVDGIETESVHQIDIPIQMDDPRLTGTLSQVFTLLRHPVSGDDHIRVFTGEYRIENEGGGWEGTAAGIERGTDSWHTVTDLGVLDRQRRLRGPDRLSRVRLDVGCSAGDGDGRHLPRRPPARRDVRGAARGVIRVQRPLARRTYELKWSTPRGPSREGRASSHANVASLEARSSLSGEQRAVAVEGELAAEVGEQHRRVAGDLAT